MTGRLPESGRYPIQDMNSEHSFLTTDVSNVYSSELLVQLVVVVPRGDIVSIASPI
jgi:hypothetical protein